MTLKIEEMQVTIDLRKIRELISILLRRGL